jgi:vacuolar-type H+-ATPase subunit H
VDAILAKLDRDLADQRLKEARERMVELESSFDSYKANRKSYLDAVLDAGASTTCKTIVSDAKARIESVSYASNKTFAENRDVIDAIVHNCEDDVADQVEAENREREAKYADEYNAYKIKRASDCEDLGKDGDNDACLNAIAKAKSDIMALTYRRAASLQSNKDDVDDIYSDLSSSLNRIRKAEADAVQLAANKLTFDSYRSAMVKAVEDMVTEDDDDSESKQLISNAMNDIKNMKYDEAKTLNQNKTAVEDVIAPLSTQLVSLRMKNAAKKLAANKAAFEDYKKSIRLVK